MAERFRAIKEKKRKPEQQQDQPRAKKRRFDVPVSFNWNNLKEKLLVQNAENKKYREIRLKYKKNKTTTTTTTTSSTTTTTTTTTTTVTTTATTTTTTMTTLGNVQIKQRQHNISDKITPGSQQSLPSASSSVAAKAKAKAKATGAAASTPSAQGQLTNMIALDCEMVGVGPEGRESALARIIVVNSYGDVVYDKFVKPREPIVDYRTRFSGIREEDLVGAARFFDVQKEVSDIIKGRLVVGHGLRNDFKALLLQHPASLVRDTARYGPFQKSRGRPHSLRYLARTVLGGLQIQKGEHHPAEDARAALLLYRFAKPSWEKAIKSNQKAKRFKSHKVAKQQKE